MILKKKKKKIDKTYNIYPIVHILGIAILYSSGY